MVLDANFLSCFTDVKMPHQMEDVIEVYEQFKKENVEGSNMENNQQQNNNQQQHFDTPNF